MAPFLRKQTSSDSIDLMMNSHHDYHQTPSITLEGSNLMVDNHLILSEVPPNVFVTSSGKEPINTGCFVGFNSEDLKSRHVVSLGQLKGIRFMSIFCFKVWWSTHWVGNKGSDVENETQLMVLDKSDLGRPYLLFLPLIEGPFRASLQPGIDENVDICIESGSNQVVGSSFNSVLYIHVGDDPYRLIKEAMKVVRAHLGTFKLLEEKTPPGTYIFELTKESQVNFEITNILVVVNLPSYILQSSDNIFIRAMLKKMLICDGYAQLKFYLFRMFNSAIIHQVIAKGIMENFICFMPLLIGSNELRNSKHVEASIIDGENVGLHDYAGILEKFGWCTWDAFYHSVHPDGVWEGVKGFAEGGCPLGLLIIDDGWKSMCLDDDDPMTDREYSSTGQQICRIANFEENKVFKNYQSKVSSSLGEKEKGMGALVQDLKATFKGLDHVYAWHALCGYWGGVRPNVPWMPESRLIYPRPSTSYLLCMDDEAANGLIKYGIGLVPPEMAFQLFDGLHSHLVSVGVDGVKVDAIHILEMMSEDYGGRVELARAYYKALTESVRKHFNGNGIISSMQQCNDFMLLGTEAVALGRVGDDFWSPIRQGASWLQGCHMVHCAYNSLWMGNFIHPDWDMFMSVHPCAEFHAASRAISGGPIYVSDPVGEHDFELLKTLALPDGSILRCEYYALPTRDCLFEDPLHDGKTMLKIWNLNKYTGVLGAFNCQGGGWCRQARKNIPTPKFSCTVSSVINVKDIEWNSGKTLISKEGVETFAVYMFKGKKLVLQEPTKDTEVSLEPFSFELFTVSPVKYLHQKGIKFAPVGLVNMLNSGGAIESMSLNDDENSVRIEVKGRGEMRVFASIKPGICRIDGLEVPFNYDEHMVVIQVSWPGYSKFSIIDYMF